jgi:CRP/FNR family transcriptional regulator
VKTLHPRDGVIARHLRRVDLFGGLDEATLSGLASGALLRLHDREERLFERGSSPFELLILVDGAARVCLPGPGGGEKVIHLAEAPCLIAEVPVLMGAPYPASAVCNTPCTVLALPRATLRELAARNPEIPLRLLGAAMERMRELTRSLAEHSRRSARGRVASYLLGFLGDLNEAELRAAKKDVASFLGLTPEAFSRALSTLRAEGILEVEGQVVRLLDRAGLARAFLDGEPGGPTGGDP